MGFGGCKWYNYYVAVKKIVNSLKIYNSLIENNKIEKLRIIDLRIPNRMVLTHEEK